MFYLLQVVGVISVVDSLVRMDDHIPVYFVKGLPAGFNAMTVPPFGIFVDEKQRDNGLLIDHEIVHWLQYLQAGTLLYYINYFVEYLLYGYDNMPMERAARYMETLAVQNNYTESVRSGAAVTVYNPSFRTVCYE